MTTGTRAARMQLAALLPAAAALYAPCIFAADTPRDLQVLQEIVVTATKRTERLQDVPISVSAITGEDIQARGFTNYADYLNTVPGVYFQDSGPGTSQIRIRGISAAEGGVPSTTATYFGETVTSILTNFGGKPNLRLVDIERVEVLRGPQGTLFGASALAGVVRIIPNAPNLQEFEADVGMRGYTTAHSDDESYHLEAAVNIPLLTDRVALRLVGYQDEVAGFIDNTFAGQDATDYRIIGDILGLPDGPLVSPAVAPFTRRDVNSENTWGGRAALTWQVSDQMKVDVMHAVQDVTLNSEPHTMPAVGDYEQSHSMDAFEKGIQGERLTLDTIVINYDWDAVSLLSASNWSEMRRSTNQDITFLAEASFGVAIPWMLRDRSKGELFTQEIRVQSRGEGPFQWLAGLYYLKQDAYFSQFVADYSCPNCIPELLGQDFAADAPWAKFSEEEQRSVFATVSYDFTERWTVGAGARYLEDELTNFGSPSDGFLLGGANEAGPTQSTTVHEFNPSAYVRFEPTEELTMYAQAGRGFRSGSVNQTTPEACAEESARRGIGTFTDPDTLWNYELGLKSQLADGRVSLNGAVYRQKWQGVQLAASLECGFTNGVNGGNVTSDGVELELLARPVDDWLFNLSVSLNKSEFDKAEPGVGYVVGERLPDSPEINGSIGAQYNFALGPIWTGFIRGDYMYVSDVRLKFEDVVQEQEAFDSANLRLAFQRAALSIELFGRNLGDERGVVTTGPPSFGGYQTLTRPREVGLELRYSFD